VKIVFSFVRRHSETSSTHYFHDYGKRKLFTTIRKQVKRAFPFRLLDRHYYNNPNRKIRLLLTETLGIDIFETF